MNETAEATSPLGKPAYLVGLIGEGISASLTPPMHEREGEANGLRYVYRILDLTELGLAPETVGTLLQQARTMGYNGLNITHPCKQLVLPFLDGISDDARRLGAVNTVLIRDGRFIGHNTDHSGFAAALAEGLPGARKGKVVQLGAGGAGSAVAYALLKSGVQTLVLSEVDRTRAQERAGSLAAVFPDQQVVAVSASDVEDQLADADGLVNATPIGMHSHPGVPVDVDLLAPRQWVADVVYRPLETELIGRAREKGCAVLDGGRMAVHQAADAFALFTGVEPDAARMRRHFLELVDAENLRTGVS
ncbi:shikimate dehydrogenase [Paenarthrobacter sp. DKR-5]|uniref:shikimate dehydrogenase n=1 Tax=Paenarthrobacter sp. DKR-5 TaxID=2835535 RepID=UPI001BDDC185|nr:shikimate dehydrogenase [Paenarthrobacter sp. DKR-5]MBT1001100.1 shikimate dehydrogenase [Paenarthrobacter sp. DKR-5]